MRHTLASASFILVLLFCALGQLNAQYGYYPGVLGGAGSYGLLGYGNRLGAYGSYPGYQPYPYYYGGGYPCYNCGGGGSPYSGGYPFYGNNLNTAFASSSGSGTASASASSGGGGGLFGGGFFG
ncbi:heterogeneous nuclear ribonucleoprotein A3 homolog 1-like [Rhagoletis pomonella]|uniref:heterogeneous nuclear ribonucleoprotein A3 homolog 1-like n=1 Tax=Rhagoletis pomonella TaxID=28610 RepID=UPI00177C0872|nr:heterogeneous nuclear ribonucleoprotein A3 homolog 1-like [Rhagoletis pomonella]